MRLLIALFFTFAGLCIAKSINGIMTEETYWWLWGLASIVSGVIGQACITTHETDCIEGTLIAARKILEEKDKQ